MLLQLGIYKNIQYNLTETSEAGPHARLLTPAPPFPVVLFFGDLDSPVLLGAFGP